MSPERLCKHCRKRFSLRPQNPDQKYCSEPACQKARKGAWQKQKLENDPDYRDNQRDAQRRWREKNPDYWREYRKRHKGYTERNRQQQRERNRGRRMHDDDLASIAKMDASITKNLINPGRYQLRRIEGGEIAKMDASIVEITIIADSYP